jgi:hypothetical protein
MRENDTDIDLTAVTVMQAIENGVHMVFTWQTLEIERK